VKIKLVRWDPLLQEFGKDHALWTIFEPSAMEAIVEAEVVEVGEGRRYSIPVSGGHVYIRTHQACRVMS
jgi:hypothetical protein